MSKITTTIQIQPAIKKRASFYLSMASKVFSKATCISITGLGLWNKVRQEHI
jgi:hypothetical protein